MTGNLSAERFRHWSVDEHGLDLYIVIKSNERDDQALAQLETELAPLLPEGWRCHRNGNNLAYLPPRSEEHTSELQSLMRISYAVFCLKNTKYKQTCTTHIHNK